jgi:hypothetical protein
MNNLIKNMLPSPLPSTTQGILTALRNVLQSLALLGLWRARFFEYAAFYGGTALHMLYGLDRFSEDLDFSLIKPSADFNFSPFAVAIQKELNAFGFETTVELKKKTHGTPVESAFIKGNTLKHLLVIEAPEHILSGIYKQSIIKIKLEIDTAPPSGFVTEMKYIFSPIQFAVRSYTLPSLFAGKMHALLCRQWKGRIKGRDWYDFVWYISYYPELNLNHLEKRMRQSGHYKSESPLTLGFLSGLIYQVIEEMDIDAARKEVSPFVSNIHSLDIWSKEFFMAAVKKIVLSDELTED